VASLSLFGNSELDAKQKRKVYLSQFAGGLGGAGIGAIASKVLNAAHEKKLFEEGIEDTRMDAQTEKDWKILMDLYNGKITMRDIPIPQRDFYEQQLEENKEQLEAFRRNPQAAEEMFENTRSGNLHPLFEDKRPSFKDFLFKRKPSQVDLTKENVVPMFEEASKMEIPHGYISPRSAILPSMLGLAGMTGAGYLMERKYQNENQDKYSENDLTRLNQMLEALRSRG
jgi:hypothetical protein